VFVSTPVATRAIAEGATPACVREQLEMDLIELKRACDEGGVLCVVQVPPALQHSHYIDAFSPKKIREIELTRGVMRRLADHTRTVAHRLGLPVSPAAHTPWDPAPPSAPHHPVLPCPPLLTTPCCHVAGARCVRDD
jgi:hypothetical protein